MSFHFGPTPDPEESIMEVYHYKNAVDDYERDGALMDSPMLKHWFVINVCDELLGEDAMYKYSPQELFEKLQEFSKDAQAFSEMCEEHDCRVTQDDMEYQRQCSH